MKRFEKLWGEPEELVGRHREGQRWFYTLGGDEEMDLTELPECCRRKARKEMPAGEEFECPSCGAIWTVEE